MTTLPEGTVTLLFTDVEGSTRMLTSLGRDRYVEALTSHRRILRSEFERHGGVEVEMQGDSFFYAFAAARDAILAAVDAQRALAAHEWIDAPIRVRVGLHTGEPAHVEGLYAGLDVHQAARVMSVAHGGQILVSERTAAVIGDSRPPDVGLRDLGVHRLKDLAEPLRLYQVEAEGLESDFPAIRSVAPPNLPVLRGALIGRHVEVAEIAGLLSDGARVVTITGPGGTGKTRVAVAVADALASTTSEQVHWVSLANLLEPDLVLPAIAQAVRAPGDVAAALSSGPATLVLDNFEQVLAAASDLGALLEQAPGVRVLVTSRAPLRIDGEREYALGPLSESDAGVLFAHAAAAIGRDTDVDDTVLSICRRLDALPLAIELAAARTRVLTPEALSARLDAALPLLTGGRRDAPERQRTLRATLDWSHDLLDAGRQRTFRRLAVFEGAFACEAAEQIADATLDDLECLAEYNLVRALPDSRFTLLVTVREYALDRLVAAGEYEPFRSSHADWYAQAARRATDGASPYDAHALRVLERDHANFGAALRTFEELREWDRVLELVTVLHAHFYVRGSFLEARRLLENGLSNAGRNSPHRLDALDALEDYLLLADDFPRVRALAEEHLELARARGNRSHAAIALTKLGVDHHRRGKIAEATAKLDDALAVSRAGGDTDVLGYVLIERGFCAASAGDLAFAEACFAEAIGHAREHRNEPNTIGSLGDLAAIRLADGRAGDALEPLREGLARARSLSYRHGMAWLLEIVGVAWVLDDKLEEGARLLGLSDTQLRALGVTRDFVFRERHDLAVATLRERLGREELDRIWAEARRDAVEDVVDAVLAALDPATPIAGVRVPAR